MDDIFLETIDFKNKMLLDKVLEWRNDMDTRNNSINTSIITEDIFHNIIEQGHLAFDRFIEILFEFNKLNL